MGCNLACFSDSSNNEQQTQKSLTPDPLSNLLDVSEDEESYFGGLPGKSSETADATNASLRVADDFTNAGNSNGGRDDNDDEEEKAVHTNTLKSLPLPIKNPQGVVISNTLYVGGGFTTSASKDAEVFVYQDSTDSWTSLPHFQKRLKTSALTCIGNKLVLLGGKEDMPSSDKGWGFATSNRVMVWDTEKNIWETPLPSMISPRVSPVVVSHNNYLIVAGGSLGNLDYRAELIDTSASTPRWVYSANLPLVCNQKTSTVVSNTWYLLDTDKGDIYHMDVDTYISQSLNTPPGVESDHALKWSKLSHKPSEDVIPFRMSTFGLQLVVFVREHGKTVMYLLEEDETWSVVIGQYLPKTIDSALVMSRDSADALLVLGGESSAGYSSKAYKVTITTMEEIQETKKGQRLRIRRPTATVFDMWTN